MPPVPYRIVADARTRSDNPGRDGTISRAVTDHGEKPMSISITDPGRRRRLANEGLQLPGILVGRYELLEVPEIPGPADALWPF